MHAIVRCSQRSNRSQSCSQRWSSWRGIWISRAGTVSAHESNPLHCKMQVQGRGFRDIRKSFYFCLQGKSEIWRVGSTGTASVLKTDISERVSGFESQARRLTDYLHKTKIYDNQSKICFVVKWYTPRSAKPCVPKRVRVQFPPKSWLLVQLAERWILTPEVIGSNPIQPVFTCVFKIACTNLQNVPVAQWITQFPPKEKIAGSRPVRNTGHRCIGRTPGFDPGRKGSTPLCPVYISVC